MKPVAIIIGVVGSVLLCIGAWIPIKATLAQLLIEQAWQASQSEGRIVKPWPWIDTWPVARLSVPGHDVSVVAMNGLSGQALAFGPGLLVPGVAAGNPSTRVIAGHNDTHFRFLEDLKPGDAIHLETQTGTLRYLVSDSTVLDVRNGPVAVSGQDQLLLITCYPFDMSATNGPLRYAVTAVREV